MKRLLILGGLVYLMGCGQMTPESASVAEPPKVTAKDPIPVAQVAASTQEMETLKRPKLPGRAQPEPSKKPGVRVVPPNSKVSKAPKARKRQYQPPVFRQPNQLAKFPHGTGRPKRKPPVVRQPIYPVAGQYQGQRVSSPVAGRNQPSYPVAGQNRPNYPVAGRYQPQRPNYPVARRPQQPNHHTPYYRPQLAMQRPNYPQAGQYQQWDKRRRQLKNDYLQARADALNIKYNRGKPRFNRHSPHVQTSALAPPLNRPMARAPWDKLGHAFDRSEAIRRDLRAHERNRPGVPRPNIPQSMRPQMYHPTARPGVPSAGYMPGGAGYCR